MSSILETNKENHAPAKPSREELLSKCRDLAKKTAILSELDKQLREHLFAGATTIPQLILLAGISRMFDDPVSAIIKGPSGSGKSFAMKAGLRYLPPSAYEEFNGMSEKALAYADLDLQNKILVIQEAAGRAEGKGLVFLRQLLTEGELRYLTVGKNSEGQVSQELRGVKGPTGLLMTTTANSLHGQDETRLLSLYVDQSPEQTKQALLFSIGDGPSKPSESVLSIWHALHEYVCTGSLEVEMPFKRALVDLLPTSFHRVKRDFPKVLGLIQAHALLHQETRERKNGKVLATLSDYETIEKLVGETLSFGLQLSVPKHVREVVLAVEKMKYDGKTPVSMTDVAEFNNRELSNTTRVVNHAINEGYLVNDNPGRGREAKLFRGTKILPTGKFLPTKNELEQAIFQPTLSGNIGAAAIRGDEGFLQSSPHLPH